MESKRNILLCVAGGTPAIITETLWALKEKNERVDEIRVITTKEGREKMLTGFLNERGGADESLIDPEHGKFYKFQKDFPKYAKNIKFQTPESFYILTKKESGVPSPRDDKSDWLDDILTDTDNKKIANQICDIVRELCLNKNVRIHASIAGGRKTMGLYLMSAMQLFAREWDTMSHVLVSKDVEFGAPKFFYKTPKPETILAPNNVPKTKADGSPLTTEDVSIYLASIPFIRLGGVESQLLKQSFTSYAEIVEQAQEHLEKNNLVFNLAEGTFKVGRRDGQTGKGATLKKLSDRDYFVYVMFAYLRWKEKGKDPIKKGFVELTEITLEDFDQICRLISRARGNERGCHDFMLLRGDSLDTLNFHFLRLKKPGKTYDSALQEIKWKIQDAISTIRLHLKKSGIPENYAIQNDRKSKKLVEPFY